MVLSKPTIRRIDRQEFGSDDPERLATREWLVTNGLGGYAAGTVPGVVTRRYHGLLIAALPAPLGRWLTFAHLSERVRLGDGSVIKLAGEPHEPGGLHGLEYLAEFRLEQGLPVWRYELPGATIEKQVYLPHEQNTVVVVYRLQPDSTPVRLKLLPAVHSRSHDAPVSTPLPGEFELRERGGRYELRVSDELPALRMIAHGQRQAFTVERQTLPEVPYRVEENRGYEARGTLWSPGYFRLDLTEGEETALVVSTEPWDTMTALSPHAAWEAEQERRRRLIAVADEPARSGLAAELVLASDQFIIKPASRAEDAARVHAAGDEARTVIAGYHWFTDWGRDTMISLEGLTLSTGRHVQAGEILRTFAFSLRDGLLPNLFPEGGREGLYHTADATMWFFHAVARYVQRSGDRATLELLLPKLIEVANQHVLGTKFGIGVDPEDGLLRQGEDGYQLTWMDAKVDDWVVTPRRGKAVEINALWYNALRWLAEWVEQMHGERDARQWSEHADRVHESFNHRFWYGDGGYLYDVVDGEQGDDPACRPNQIFALSLDHAVLNRGRWEPVLRVVKERLLTPVGLRSLAPDHDDYQPRYFGDIYARDAAYHQGTVWGWLIGPFVDAWLRVHPDDRAGARRWLEGFDAHLNEACVGSISEVFDAEEPFTPRGCVAQAWSVAEVLRCLINTAEPVS